MMTGLPVAHWGFNPREIGGIALWLDAADALTITQVAGAVSQWNDKSGLGNHVTQGTAARQPITGTRTIGGRNGLDFDGSNDGFTGPSGLYGLSAGPNTAFCVYTSDATGDATQHVFAGYTAGSGPRYLTGLTSTNSIVENRSTSNLPTSQAAAWDTNPHISGFKRSGVNITPFYDGVAGTDGTNSEDFTSSSFIIGNNPGFSTTRFNGILGEIIIYSAALSTASINNVGRYLKAKWGVTWTGL